MCGLSFSFGTFLFAGRERKNIYGMNERACLGELLLAVFYSCFLKFPSFNDYNNDNGKTATDNAG
jgi:hypothetical protein